MIFLHLSHGLAPDPLVFFNNPCSFKYLCCVVIQAERQLYILLEKSSTLDTHILFLLTFPLEFFLKSQMKKCVFLLSKDYFDRRKYFKTHWT